jgi:subfamily B ATP-binding cassette protein MsbA
MLKNKFKNLRYFYQYLGYKIFIAMGISIVVGVLDGFGLSMFLPLLQMVSESDVDADKMGNLSFLVDFIESLGINLTLASALLFMVFFFVLKGIVKYIGEVYNVILNQYFIKKIRLKTLNSLNNISFKYFVTSDAGRIQNTMTGEVDRVATAYQTYFRTFQEGVLVAVYMSFAFFVNWQFAILVAIGGWFTNFLYKYIYKLTKGSSKKYTKDTHAYQGEVIQEVANYKYLKATGLLNAFGKRLEISILKIEETRRKIGFLNAILIAAREPMLMGVVAAVIVIQTQVLGGQLSQVLISLLFFYRALTSLTLLQTSWNSYLSVSGSLENVKSFQKELDGNYQTKGHKKVNVFTKAIELNAVNFNYGDTPILKDISLSIHKNESIAFVGESGSGKTTLVNLVAGLLIPESGELSIDGILHKELDLDSYQKRIGYITQEPVIFNDTIYNNVSFWAEKTPENIARFKQAIQKAAIAEFIDTLPEKENTALGNNGINLSGGQKQRISIARELYKDIDILIMDEATSALDSETEKSIQNQIEQLQGEYTLIIIAHRLSTIKNAGRVVLMYQGEIKSVGSFKELIAKDERFKNMVDIQEV